MHGIWNNLNKFGKANISCNILRLLPVWEVKDRKKGVRAMGKGSWKKRRRYAALLLAFGLLAGCGAGAGGEGDGGLGDERTWAAGSGELSSRIGNPDNAVSAPANDAGNIAAEEWWTLAGYGQPTGKWFLQDGAGHLGYGLTAGTHRPGDAVTVELFAHEADFRLDRDIRIRLTELTDELEPAAVILDTTVHAGPVGSHEVVYTGTLPDKLNALYVLGAEIVGEDGGTEDTRAALIRVPAPEINASVRLDRAVYGSGEETAVLAVMNAGPTVLTFGVDYHIEKKVDGEWRIVPLDLAFDSIGLMLQPGQQHELKVHLGGLGPGEYRVVKPLRAEGLDLTAELAAEFTIES